MIASWSVTPAGSLTGRRGTEPRGVGDTSPELTIETASQVCR